MKKYRICLYLLFFVCIFTASFYYLRNALPNKRFRDFTSALFKNEVTANALTLHYTLAHPKDYGIKDYEVTLGSISETDSMKACSAIENLNVSLQALDHPQLTEENRLTFDILSYYLERRQENLDFYLYPELFSPSQGLQSQLPIVLAEYEFRNKKDIEDYLSLLSSLDTYFTEAVEFEKYRAENGILMADFAIEEILEQCETFIGTEDSCDSHLLAKSFENRVANADFLVDAERTFFLDQNKTILKEHVFPAYRILADSMQELLPNAPDNMALCSYPNGQKYYEQLICEQTGSDKTIPELKRFMQKQFTSQYLAYLNLQENNESLPAGKLGEEFGNSPELMLEDLKNKIEQDFPALPDTTYTVKYVEEELQDFMSPAFYMTPAIDAKDKNVIYINPGLSYSPLGLYTTLAHEGYPGHLYQTNFFHNHNTDPLRSLLYFGGYTEGWALYVEMYSYHLFDTDKTIREATRLNHIIQLALYSLMDIAIHYDGLSEADIIHNLARCGITDKETARDIYQYISEEPGNYLKYYVGYLEILELKEMMQEQKMNEFNLKEFHRLLLETGPAPFPIIKKNIMN